MDNITFPVPTEPTTTPDGNLPMTVVSAEVDWYERFDSWPRLVVTVNRMPEPDDFRWRRSTLIQGCYFAELDGNVRFFFATDNHEGYGGRTFHLTMENGSTVDLHGPWSGDSDLVNGGTEFGPVVSVVIKERDGKYPELGYASAATLEWAEHAVQFVRPSVRLMKVDHPHLRGPMWVPWGHSPVAKCTTCFRRLRDGACPDHGAPCAACKGLGEYELPPKHEDDDAGWYPCPVCQPWATGFPGYKQFGKWIIEPAGPGHPAVYHEPPRRQFVGESEEPF